jgi:hypothetical protein
MGKTTDFTTPWGNFMYDNMPFVLINVGAIFQRNMDIEFIEKKDIFIFIDLNDMIIFSKIDEDHKGGLL